MESEAKIAEIKLQKDLNKSKIILLNMDVTKLSTKGQIIIPEKIRRGLEVGSSFLVSKVDELIVLKPVENLSTKEQNELKELNKIWKEIDSNKAKKYSEKEFFEAMKKW